MGNDFYKDLFWKIFAVLVTCKVLKYSRFSKIKLNRWFQWTRKVCFIFFLQKLLRWKYQVISTLWYISKREDWAMSRRGEAKLHVYTAITHSCHSYLIKLFFAGIPETDIAFIFGNPEILEANIPRNQKECKLLLNIFRPPKLELDNAVLCHVVALPPCFDFSTIIHVEAAHPMILS